MSSLSRRAEAFYEVAKDNFMKGYHGLVLFLHKEASAAPQEYEHWYKRFIYKYIEV